MDENQSGKVKSFFYGQYFESGLRITFGIIFPALVFSYFGSLIAGITLSLGALCLAITDIPGPVYHKRNGMFFTLLFITLTSFFTGMLSSFPVLLGIEIPILCFFFAMLNIYGTRASLAGSATLLIMMISTDQNHLLNGYVMHSLFVFGGGAWYMILSMSLTKIRPYRLAQQALGECVLAISTYLKTRAGFYDDKTSIEDTYKELVLQQIQVNQQLDAVREIVLKSRKMVNEQAGAGKLLILTFSDLIDLFEYAMSIPYDYAEMRRKFLHYNVLPAFSDIILKFSIELNNLGYSLINNEIPRKKIDLLAELEILKSKISELEEKDVSVFVLKKVLINLLTLHNRLDIIFKYFQQDKKQFSETKNIDLDKFVSHQQFSWKLFVNNLNLNSTTFRHSIRLAIACLLGFLISQWMSFGQHSYWILVTILVILKPDYSLTKQRNNERVIGTIIGAITGVLILYLVKDEIFRFIILLIFMVLTFTYNRTRYVISVLFMTPFILILFSFVSDSNNLDLVKERIIDTLMGSSIALAANYFIFPTWESRQKSPYLIAILTANLDYLLQILSKFKDEEFSVTSYKLARKEVYVQTSNLASAFQRMLHEPKHKKKNISPIYQFLVLNHILSSYLSTLSLTMDENKLNFKDQELPKTIRKIYVILTTALQNLGSDAKIAPVNLPVIEINFSEESSDTSLLSEQLGLILKVSSDIEKHTKSLESQVDNRIEKSPLPQ